MYFLLFIIINILISQDYLKRDFVIDRIDITRIYNTHWLFEFRGYISDYCMISPILWIKFISYNYITMSIFRSDSTNKILIFLLLTAPLQEQPA